MKHPYVLYVPFAKTEGNDELLSMAESWQKQIKKEIKASKTTEWQEKNAHLNRKPMIPPIVTYLESSEPLRELPEGVRLYVLAHSTELPEYVANYGDKPTKLMFDANELARRLCADGLPKRTPEAPQIIKLYICDEGIGKTEDFAKAFHAAMKKHERSVDTQYYFGGSVAVPKFDTKTGLTHKYVVTDPKEFKFCRASTRRFPVEE
jgi:hypothetical protein